MLRSRALQLLISSTILAVVVLGDHDLTRTKRQAPNINVHEIPKTSFSCVDRRIGDYYADPEANCQVYHVCIPGMHNKMSLISFVCPNGTIFSQATRVCTPYERVDCSLTDKFYENVHGGANSRRTDYDNELVNYVPQPPPREQSPPPRPSSRGRNTPAPTVPPREIPAQPPRNSRFRTGSNQFRGQQGAPATTVAPAPSRATAPPAPARVAPARPVSPSFRPPVIPVRSPVGAGLPNVVPPRPTPRTGVSTSTSSYNYDYEYEYEYEDETTATDQGNTRSKREATAADDYDLDSFEENFEKSGFNCNDKVAGGVYADMESNCEMFHICVPLGKYKMLDYKVFCANGTAFDQETGSCREKGEFTCENAHLYYQFEKPNQPASSKKPIFKKKKLSKSKKAKNINKD